MASAPAVAMRGTAIISGNFIRQNDVDFISTFLFGNEDQKGVSENLGLRVHNDKEVHNAVITMSKQMAMESSVQNAYNKVLNSTLSPMMQKLLEQKLNNRMKVITPTSEKRRAHLQKMSEYLSQINKVEQATEDSRYAQKYLKEIEVLADRGTIQLATKPSQDPDQARQQNLSLENESSGFRGIHTFSVVSRAIMISLFKFVKSIWSKKNSKETNPSQNNKPSKAKQPILYSLVMNVVSLMLTMHLMGIVAPNCLPEVGGLVQKAVVLNSTLKRKE